MPDFLAWFQLRPERGLDYAQNLEPIREVAVTLNLPQRVAGQILPTGTQVCTITPAPALTDELLVRIIPDTRIIETSSMLAAQSLSALSIFEQIERPSKAALAAAKDETKAHMAAIDTYAAEVAKGNTPAPDASDARPAVESQTGVGVLIPGAVEHHLTADERLVIDEGIAAGDIVDDERFAVWVAATTIDDLITAIGDDRLLAKRVLVAEEERADTRKGLVEKLTAALTTMPEEG